MSHFRLPSKEELETLIHPDKDRSLFGKDGWFWSSSPYANYTYGAWVVHFVNGNVDWFGKNVSNQVRLVRAGSALAIDDSVDAAAPDRLIDNGDGTHTDRRTGLIWKSQPENGSFTWDEAMTAFPALPASNFVPQTPVELNWSTLGPAIQWG